MTMVLGNRIVTANMLELASALLYIEDMRHARRIMVGGCVGNKTVWLRERKSFHDISGIFRVCSCTALTDTAYQEPVRQNLPHLPLLHPP